MPDTGVTVQLIVLGYFLLAMKIAITSFITEMAARLKIVWTPLRHSHVQGIPCSHSVNGDVYCVVNVSAKPPHTSRLSRDIPSCDSDDYAAIPSTHVVWLTMSGVACVTRTRLVKQRPRERRAWLESLEAAASILYIAK
uniref:Uncharacterized protein n=1 Tax=Pipistrellus kuhlii TaxID=59472 RepID=A0A7J8B2X6_PIPKU|nr:hypothetical protein mPipKuh1_007888 [Pipistrellus kuhlii]